MSGDESDGSDEALLPHDFTEVGSGDETVNGRMLRDGTTAHSYVFELLAGGITTPQHIAFLGNMFASMNMAFETDAIVTGSLTVLGKDMNDASASSVGFSCDAPSPWAS